MADDAPVPEPLIVPDAAAWRAWLDAHEGTSDGVRMYLREIGQVDLLTAEDERRLAHLIEEGHRAAQRIDECQESGCVDDAELPDRLVVVRGRQPVDDLPCVEPVAEEREPLGAVAGVRVGLRRDRADLRRGPRDDGADREELRLCRHAPLARVEIARADRVRRDEPLSHR